MSNQYENPNSNDAFQKMMEAFKAASASQQEEDKKTPEGNEPAEKSSQDIRVYYHPDDAPSIIQGTVPSNAQGNYAPSKETVAGTEETTIRRLVAELFKEEDEFQEDLEEELRGSLFWATMFPEYYADQFGRCYFAKDQETVVKDVLMCLTEKGAHYGEMLDALVQIFAEVWGNIDDRWYLNQAMKYLEKARAEGVMNPKRYKRVYKNLSKYL